jgi:serine/threonine protein phosphatase 1
MAIYAIGDIHGCHTALSTLLREVNPGSNDLVIFLGDYVDRGPDSRSVLEVLTGLAKAGSPVFLRGNHEAMMLEARTDPYFRTDLWRDCGGMETLRSYGLQQRGDWASLIPRAHWSFLEATVRGFETPTHIFVHACLRTDLDLEQQPDRWLYWELFDELKPHKSGKKVICGHTSQRSGHINDLGFAACIDTGVNIGGWLTCLDVDSGRYWQANEKGNVRDGGSTFPLS